MPGDARNAPGAANLCRRLTVTHSTDISHDGQSDRQCTRCLLPLPLSAFGKAKKGPGGLNWNCRECVRNRERERDPQSKRDASRRYEESHPNTVRARKRRWEQANAEKRKEQGRQYVANNPEQIKASRQRDYDKHRQQYIDRARRWADSNAEKVQKAKRAWIERQLASDPDGFRARALEKGRRYRARKNEAPGEFTRAEFETLCETMGNVCLRCGITGEFSPLHADHVVAISRGGSNDIDNIQPLCESCNKSKGARHVDYRPLTYQLGGCAM